MKTNVEVPELDHDKMMLERFGTVVSPNGRLERRIVANLCAHLHEAGFELVAVYDGEERTRVRTAKEAMELIFDLDEVSLRVKKSGRGRLPEHGILLVLGIGCDIVSDWNYSVGDADGFSAAMDQFDAEDYA